MRSPADRSAPRAAAATQRIARGDFQTPIELARQVCELLAREGVAPATVIEPTCGVGAFAVAAVERFASLRRLVATDLEESYVAAARQAVATASAARAPAAPPVECDWRIEDCFAAPWRERLAALPRPVVLLGNPPWVTTARLATVGAANGPPRANVDRVRGIEALTGRGHFDVSEALLRLALRLAGECGGVVALLCKVAVARKALAVAWREEWAGLASAECSLRRIEARRWFGASVAAGLLLVRADRVGELPQSCAEHEELAATTAPRRLGWRDGELLADVEGMTGGADGRADRGAVGGAGGATGSGVAPLAVANLRWRSGIKHDAAARFELVGDGRHFVNGLGEELELEPELVFPLQKATDLARDRPPTRWLLVPQRTTAEEPAARLAAAPLARAYLERHAEVLAQRKSRIYRGRPANALFGVGPYSFTDWKVAVSALHMPAQFRVIGPWQGRPVVFDDTCCLLPCRDEAEAHACAARLSSRDTKAFLAARTFTGRKRPLTVALLDRVLESWVGE